jgi:hypothetical protein
MIFWLSALTPSGVNLSGSIQIRHKCLEFSFDVVKNCGATHALQARPYSRAVRLSLVKSLAQSSMTSRRTSSRFTAHKSNLSTITLHTALRPLRTLLAAFPLPAAYADRDNEAMREKMDDEEQIHRNKLPI